MKKKSIQSVLILAALYYLIISLSSCTKDNNPVIPPPPPPVHPDTADRYVWTGTDTDWWLTHIYAADTNKIYIVGDGLLFLFDGINLKYYDLNDHNFYANNLYGYDKNNIFILGTFSSNNTQYSELKKITNGVITSYYWTSRSSLFRDLLVTGPNQVWISDFYIGKVYYFNNGVINEYVLNKVDSLIYNSFYLGQDNSIYAFGIKSANLTTGFLYSYKLVNNNFELLQTEYFDHFPFLFRCGKDVMMYQYNTSLFKFFNGNNWEFHSDPGSMPWVLRMGGISKDSLVLIDQTGRILTYGVNNWRVEKNTPNLFTAEYPYFYNAEVKFGNVYSTFLGRNSQNKILTGKPNKILKK